MTSSGPSTSLASSADTTGNGAEIIVPFAATVAGDDDVTARSGAESCATAVVVLPSRVKVIANKLFIAFLEGLASRLWEKPPQYGKQQIVLLSTFFVADPHKQVAAACQLRYS